MTVQGLQRDVSTAQLGFVVTVDFRIKAESIETFSELVRENAIVSLSKEPQCRRFEILVPDDETHPGEFFLYEVYDNRASFVAHLQSEHFRAFDEATRDMVLTKTVREMVFLDG